MKMKNIVMIILLASIMPTVSMAMGQLHQSKQIVKIHDVYYCPMHPQNLYDHPGNCPICGMKLIKKGAEVSQQRPACSCCNMKRS